MQTKQDDSMDGTWEAYHHRCLGRAALGRLYDLSMATDPVTDPSEIALHKRRLLGLMKDDNKPEWIVPQVLVRTAFFLADLDLLMMLPEADNSERKPRLLLTSSNIDYYVKQITPIFLEELLKRYSISNRYTIRTLLGDEKLRDVFINHLSLAPDWMVACYAWAHIPDSTVAENMIRELCRNFPHIQPETLTPEDKCVIALAGHPLIDYNEALSAACRYFESAHEAMLHAFHFKDIHTAHAYRHARRLPNQ